jgi:aminopeptidase YwaD
MKDQIQDIITRFGPRLAGSQAERDAQEYIASGMKELTNDVQIETFQAPLKAKFGKMKWYAIGYMISLVLFLFSPVASLVVSLICGIVIVCDLMRNDGIADFLFPLETSRNVSATLEPQGNATSTLIFSGHIDSTQECTWWYKYKKYGAHMTIAAGLLIALFPVFVLWFVASGQIFPAEPGAITVNILIYFLFVLLSPVTVIYFSFHGDIVVEGACDNLSGIIISRNVVSAFADPNNKGKSILKKTRIRFVSFGAEEKGLRGSTAYCKRHLKEMQEENACLLNSDSIRLAGEISIITGEMMSFVSFDEGLVNKTEKAFQAQNIFYKKGRLPMGGTDAIPFQQRGIPALSIIGMNMKSLDPTYHTRLDTIDNVEQEALDNVRDGLIELVKEWDSV